MQTILHGLKCQNSKRGIA